MSKYYSSSIAFGAKQTNTEKVVVSPTKIGDVTTDAVSGALTVDEVPTLDSLNPVSSDGVARAVIQAGAELPTRGSSDTGKVLTVANSDGDLEWDTPEGGIPDMTGKNGKVLGAVDDNGTMTAQWVDQPTVPTLATVATTGSYDDLTNKPSIPAAQVNADWNAVSGVSQILNKPNLATVATTGSYSDLTNKPSIPAAQVNADWNSVSGVSQILNKPSLAAVATSGSYADLTGTPTIPTVPPTDQTYNSASTNPQSGVAVAQAIAAIPSATYTAGTGINITSNVISADIDNSTIKTALEPSVIQSARNLIQLSSGYGAFEINSDVKAKLTQDSSASSSKLKIHIPGNVFSFTGDVTSGQDSSVYVQLCSDKYFNDGSTTALFPVALTNTYNSQRQKTYIDEQDIEISCYMADWLSGRSGYPLAPTTLNPATSSPSSHWYMGFFRCDGTHTSNQAYGASSSSLPPDYAVVISKYVAGNKLCVNLPSLTTAGISDVQLVNALPASPVATVLYLISET